MFANIVPSDTRRRRQTRTSPTPTYSDKRKDGWCDKNPMGHGRRSDSFCLGMGLLRTLDLGLEIQAGFYQGATLKKDIPGRGNSLSKGMVN